jgi:hypothetical protein
MNPRRTIDLLSRAPLAALAGLIACSGGCSSTPVPVGQESGDSGGTGTSTGTGSGSGTGTGTGSGSGTGTGTGAGDAGALRWWYSCGYPACQAVDDAGADAGLVDDAGALCPPVGSACATSGDTCGARDAAHCGVNLECSASDPTKGFGGCPISSRKFKENVTYVDDAQLEMLHDEAIHMKLATYNYKPQFDDPNPRHLGFIIEDDPRSPAVDRSFDRVDLYGYLSMAVAAMQVQEKEIAELRRELDAARIGSCRASSPTDPGRR